MENDKIVYTLIEGYPDHLSLQKIEQLYKELFEDAALIFFRDRLVEQTKSLSILAYNEVNLIGFKVGYPYNGTTFYSWVGGVNLEYRKLGIATKLAELQETYARKEGYKKLRTKSMNIYKPMMILNLKNGFDITKFYTNNKGQTKIVFEKQLR